MPDLLSPMDAAFLDVEDRSHGMHLSALLTFGGDPPGEDEFRVAVERQLPFLPRFRQRIARVPLALGRPVWVDAESFDPADHLGVVELSAEDDLTSFAADYAERRLHPDRPLWDVRLVRGLPDGQWALAVKLHHAMVDGLSIMEVIGCLFSAEPDRPVPDPRPWTPSPAPSRVVLTRRALVHLVAGLRHGRRIGRGLRAAVGLRSILGQAPRTALTGGNPSARRRTEWLQVPLADLKALKTRAGGTVNDIVLTAVAGALRQWMQARGDQARRVHTFVPVSLRDDDDRSSLGNRIGLTFPGLPVDVSGWRERLADVRRTTDRAAQLRQARQTAGAIELGETMPAFASRQLNRFIQLRARVFSLTCTNVPGPPVPVYFCGRPMLAMLGSAPLTSEHAMTIAALSYNGTMFFSVTYDPQRLPDGGEVMAHVRTELDTMLEDVAEVSNFDSGGQTA